jgi:hypothetical protein
MARIKAEEVFKVFVATLLYNLAFTLFLYPWVTENDIENLPKEPSEKAWTLFFFSVTSFTTIGFGEFGSIKLKSRRLKIIVTLFILLAISGAASFFFDF